MRHILLNDNLSSQTLTCDFSGLSYSASLGSNNVFLSTDTGCKIIYKTENNKSYIIVSDKNTSTVLFEIGENDSTNTSPIKYNLSSNFGTVTTLNTDAYGYTNIHVDESAGNSPVCLKPYETIYSTYEMKTGEIWIDGKPIYRKVIPTEVTNFSGTIDINLGVDNIGIIIDDKVIVDTDTFTSIGHTASTTSYYIAKWVFRKNLKTVTISTNISTLTGTIYVVIKYTKTTD